MDSLSRRWYGSWRCPNTLGALDRLPRCSHQWREALMNHIIRNPFCDCGHSHCSCETFSNYDVCTQPTSWTQCQHDCSPMPASMAMQLDLQPGIPPRTRPHRSVILTLHTKARRAADESGWRVHWDDQEQALSPRPRQLQAPEHRKPTQDLIRTHVGMD